MAQVAATPAPLPVGTDGVPLTADDLREILEYEKIVQFRDAVLAGTHPRVKIPSHLVGKLMNATRNTSSPNLSAHRATVASQSTRSASGPNFENSSPYHNNKSPNDYHTSTGGHAAMASKSEIDPIFLEKSDDLIKAEIQLQRQRLERALRDQIEQQRVSAKALLQTSESLPNFDLSEVLSKALAIVHPSVSAEGEASIDASASDSFDENTFYSSQHDSLEPSNSPESQKDTGEVKSRNLASVDKRPIDAYYSSNTQVKNHDAVMTGSSLSTDNYLPSQAHPQSQQVSSQLQTQMMGQTSQLGNSGSSGSHNIGVEGARKVNGNENDEVAVSTNQNISVGTRGMNASQIVDQPGGQNAATQLLDGFGGNRDSPLVRAHNLSPLAPQPARVSPLATARNPPIIRENLAADEPPPAQVAALRQKPSGLSSTDSSPKGVKDSGKKKSKKEKKKKRKASSNENVAGTPDSPYIKPEPRSPSPFAVAPLPRPQKRQRQSGQYAAELNYDEPRYEPTEEIQERIPDRYQEAHPVRTYDLPEGRFEPQLRRPAPTFHRVEREEGDYRRVSGGYYAKRPESPVYAANEARPVRAAITERKVYEEPVYYREPMHRASARPDIDRERSRSPIMRDRRSSPIQMGPPRRPVRIIIDEYGREYIDPTPIPSMPPPSRYRESDIVYERAPPRSVSGRAPVAAYDEEGVVYRRPSPVAATRRVVTQPEYALPEYRSYRQREYSTRPMAPPGEEYIQVRAPERRQVSNFEEVPREYATRAPSIRPELVRYEEPPQDYVRAPSVRPEPVRYEEPSRDYVRATTVRPEPARYDELPREYVRAPTVRPEPARYDEAPREYARAPTVRPEPARYDEAPREYIRAPTVRPEPVRYEIPREYRLQSAMPEPPLREFAASVRPEARREIIPHNVRPLGSIPQAGTNNGGYYDEGNGLHRNPLDAERPRVREASVMIYQDDVRREVYR